MRVYFEENNAGNIVVITDGKTAKVFDGASDGTYEGIDLYSEDAVEQLRARFAELLESGELNDYADIYSPNEINPEEMESLMAELEELEAELVFDTEAENE